MHVISRVGGSDEYDEQRGEGAVHATSRVGVSDEYDEQRGEGAVHATSRVGVSDEYDEQSWRERCMTKVGISVHDGDR